jgi:hypothetical protein
LAVTAEKAVVTSGAVGVLEVPLSPVTYTSDTESGSTLSIRDEASLVLDSLVVLRGRFDPDYCAGSHAASAEIYPLAGGPPEVLTYRESLQYLLHEAVESPDKQWAVLIRSVENSLEGYAVFRRGGSRSFVRFSGACLTDTMEFGFTEGGHFEIRGLEGPRYSAGPSECPAVLRIHRDGSFTQHSE